MQAEVLLETLLDEFERHLLLLKKSRMIQMKSERQVLECLEQLKQLQKAPSRIGKER